MKIFTITTSLSDELKNEIYNKLKTIIGDHPLYIIPNMNRIELKDATDIEIELIKTIREYENK